MSRQPLELRGGRSAILPPLGLSSLRKKLTARTPQFLEHFPCCWGSRNSCAAAFSLRKTPIKVAALDYTYREKALAPGVRLSRIGTTPFARATFFSPGPLRLPGKGQRPGLHQPRAN